MDSLILSFSGNRFDLWEMVDSYTILIGEWCFFTFGCLQGFMEYFGLNTSFVRIWLHTPFIIFY